MSISPRWRAIRWNRRWPPPSSSRDRSRARRDLRADQQRRLRAGFATTQAAYDIAVTDLFAALAHWDPSSGDQPFVCGTRMTEADIAQFTTLLRFESSTTRTSSAT